MCPDEDHGGLIIRAFAVQPVINKREGSLSRQKAERRRGAAAAPASSGHRHQNKGITH